MIVFPHNSGKNKKVKQGDSNVEEQKQATQVNLHEVMPVGVVKHKSEARKITADEKADQVAKTLRKARTDAQRWGARINVAAKKVRSFFWLFYSQIALWFLYY